jgi:outer membrane protein TolC
MVLTLYGAASAALSPVQAASPSALAQAPGSFSPAPVLPSSVSQPGAPPPTISVPGSFNSQSAPSQPGVPALQPTMPSPINSLPPVQTQGRTVPSVTLPTAAEIAPPANYEAPITLFENPPSGSSGPWGSLLSGSVTKMRAIPIDLPTVLKLVEAQNLPVAQNRLSAKISNLTYYRTLSDMLPDFQGSYVQSRFQGSILVFGNATVQVFQTRIVPQFAVSWTVRPGGEDLFLALAAKQRAKGAKFTTLDTLNNQLTLAANAYYDLLSGSVQVENSRLSIQETASQVKLNEARLNAGIGTKLDLERARSQLVAREQILIDAENTLARTQQALLNVLNLDPEVELSPAQVPVQPHPLVPFELTTEQLLARAQANNPSLQVSAMELRALQDESKAALSRIVPSITMQSYIGGLGPRLHELGLTRFGGFTVQANLLENLGTAIPLDYAARRLAVKRELLVRAQQIRDLQTQVINAYLDSRSSVKGIMAAQEQLAVAQEAYRLAFGRFKAGLGINVDVLDAQTALSAARTTVVRAILSFNQAQVRLLNALGDSTTPNILNGIPAHVFTQPPARKK